MWRLRIGRRQIKSESAVRYMERWLLYGTGYPVEKDMSFPAANRREIIWMMKAADAVQGLCARGDMLGGCGGRRVEDDGGEAVDI